MPIRGVFANVVEPAAPALAPFIPDFYISTTGSDGANGLTPATAWATFSHAWTIVTAGNKVGVLNGSYSADISPPQGKAGSVGKEILFRAMNDGGVSLTTDISLKANSYLTFEGFKVVTTNPLTVASDGVVGASHVSHHNTFRRIGFQSTYVGSSPNPSTVILTDGSHDNLIEDCWVWGGGRYKILLYGGNGGGGTPNLGCDFNTLRRVVVRYDAHGAAANEPQASVGFYYASHNLAENLLLIDGIQDPASGTQAGFYTTGAADFGATEMSFNTILGSIVVNNTAIAWWVDVGAAGTAQFNAIKNSVLWTGDHSQFGSANGSGATNSLMQHCTIGANSRGTYNQGPTIDFLDNLLYDNNVVGFQLAAGSVDLWGHDQYFNNVSNVGGIALDGSDITTSPQLLYFARVEAATPGKGTASDGGDRGANVVKRYVDGVLTSADLWPWPYEARIRSEMSNVSRGWTAGAKTLTKYIWEYLGNASPY